MATNKKFDDVPLQLVATDPASPTSGSPVRVGEMVGVAVDDKNATTGRTTVDFDGTYKLSVKGIDGGGNAAVAIGDVITYTDADTPKLSKKAVGATARKIGYALETVGSGLTATIAVKLSGSH